MGRKTTAGKPENLPAGMRRETDGRLIFRMRWPVAVGRRHPDLAGKYVKETLNTRDMKTAMPRYVERMAAFNKEVARLLAPTDEEQQSEWFASLSTDQRRELQASFGALIGPKIAPVYPAGTVFRDNPPDDDEDPNAPQIILPPHPSGNPFLAQEPVYKAAEETLEQSIARAAELLRAARIAQTRVPLAPTRSRRGRWGDGIQADLAEMASRLERMLEGVKSHNLPADLPAHGDKPTLALGFEAMTHGMKDDRYKGQIAWSLRLFHGIIGEKALADLRTDDLATFEMALKKMPISTSTRNAIQAGRMTVREVIDAWTKETRVLAPTAIAKHVGFIRSMSAFAFARGGAEGKTDPFATFRRLRVEKVKAQKYFRPAEMELLFAEMSKRWLKRDRDRIWISLLALFHGARREEICQLLKSDVRKIDGTWCIAITTTDEPDDESEADFADEGDLADTAKRLKSEAAERIIPIHHRVLEAGFIEHLKRSKGPRIFDSLTQDSDGRWGGNFGKRFAELKATAGVKGRRTLTFHSFRHTAIGAMRNLGFPHAAQLALVGHAFDGGGGVNDNYGDALKPANTKPWVDKVAYNVKSLDDILVALKAAPT